MPLFFYLDLIITTSPTAKVQDFPECFKICFSLRLRRYSFDHLFTLHRCTGEGVGSAPQIYISNLLWLQARQDFGGRKHHRIWNKDWERHIILHIAKGPVILHIEKYFFQLLPWKKATLYGFAKRILHLSNHPLKLSTPPWGATKVELPDDFVLGKDWLNFSSLIVFLKHPATPTNVEPLSE